MGALARAPRSLRPQRRLCPRDALRAAGMAAPRARILQLAARGEAAMLSTTSTGLSQVARIAPCSRGLRGACRFGRGRLMPSHTPRSSPCGIDDRRGGPHGRARTGWLGPHRVALQSSLSAGPEHAPHGVDGVAVLPGLALLARSARKRLRASCDFFLVLRVALGGGDGGRRHGQRVAAGRASRVSDRARRAARTPGSLGRGVAAPRPGTCRCATSGPPRRARSPRPSGACRACWCACVSHRGSVLPRPLSCADFARGTPSRGPRRCCAKP